MRLVARLARVSRQRSSRRSPNYAASREYRRLASMIHPCDGLASGSGGLGFGSWFSVVGVASGPAVASGGRHLAGTCATAASTVARWPAAVLLPAFPGLSSTASDSPVLPHQAVSG